MLANVQRKVPDLHLAYSNTNKQKRKLKSMVKQKLYGCVMLAVSIILTVSCIIWREDMSILLITYPVALFLMFSKHYILIDKLN